MRKPCIVVGGTTSGVGKTSIAVGLMAALRCEFKSVAIVSSSRPLYNSTFKLRCFNYSVFCRDRGLTVQAFKVGAGML